MTDIARGLEGIAVAETHLSHVDGERGELVIAGFPVEALAPQASYEEVLHLLWHGERPSGADLEALRRDLAAQRALPAATRALLEVAAASAVPAMDALRMGVATLSLADPEPAAATREAQRRRAVGVVARLPTLVATLARLRQGQRPVEPDAALGHVANYLYMLDGRRPEPAVVRALETYLNTVIDHGMNASTFAARVIVSTRSDMVSAIAGAVGALKGPLHGGAPGPALDMVFDIRARARRSGQSLATAAEDWARETVTAGGRIMGFGHRVYKVRDPRAEVLGAEATRLFERTGDTSLYEDARTVEAAALRVLRALKPGRRLETNVEFYTALLLHGVGLDPDLFTPTFAVGRVGGWTAHVLEQIADDRLIRPDAVYRGPRARCWVPADPPQPVRGPVEWAPGMTAS
jgi:citrate synthase